MSELIKTTLMPSEIPSRPPAVQVDLGKEPEIPTDSEAMIALQRQGFAEMNKRKLKDLQTIGLYVHSLGTVRTQQGRVMVSQQRLDDAQRALHKELLKRAVGKSKTKVNDMVRLSQMLGYVVSKQVEAVKVMIQLEGGRAATEDGAPIDGLVPTFTPGAQVKGGNVILTRELHMHQDAPATTK